MRLLGKILLFFLILSFVVVQLFKYNDNWKNFYNLYVQRGVSLIQRFLVGTAKFSVGEIIIILVILLLIFILVLLVNAIVNYKLLDTYKSINLCIWVVNLSLFFYVSYQTLWGLNYNRQPNKYFTNQSYSTNLIYDIEDLKSLANTLLDKIQYSYSQVVNQEPQSLDKIYDKAFLPYKRYLIYKSIKPSLFSGLLSYSGVSGYYNFISGEAIINKNYPVFLLPFVVCHEIAHQKGIASEGQANFEGFMHALQTKDPVFIYSASITAFFYTLRYIGLNSSQDDVKVFVNELPGGVKDDMEKYYAYIKKYKGKIDRVTSVIYDAFLKSNKQVNGIRSYDEYVYLLIQWNKSL
ncbi:MAG: DUF3810 family protein [Solitalea-like symbiont of Tyrophagus putrescentiae]